MKHRTLQVPDIFGMFREWNKARKARIQEKRERTKRIRGTPYDPLLFRQMQDHYATMLEGTSTQRGEIDMILTNYQALKTMIEGSMAEARNLLVEQMAANSQTLNNVTKGIGEVTKRTMDLEVLFDNLGFNWKKDVPPEVTKLLRKITDENEEQSAELKAAFKKFEGAIAKKLSDQRDATLTAFRVEYDKSWDGMMKRFLDVISRIQTMETTMNTKLVNQTALDSLSDRISNEIYDVRRSMEGFGSRVITVETTMASSEKIILGRIQQLNVSRVQEEINRTAPPASGNAPLGLVAQLVAEEMDNQVQRTGV